MTRLMSLRSMKGLLLVIAIVFQQESVFRPLDNFLCSRACD